MTHIKNLTIRAILAASICVIAPLCIPAGAVPITAATLIIFVVSACTDISFSLPAVLLYITLGAFGLPVFSGFTGGLHILAGVTGGFIIGYIPCTALISLICTKYGEKKFPFPLSMILGTLILYIFGTAWHCIVTDNSVTASATVCILPFIPGDIIKIVVASIISPPLKSRLMSVTK